MITTIILIISLYILSIFITRYLNYIAYKLDYYTIEPAVWFIPIIGLIVWLLIVIKILLITKTISRSTWFIDKHW